ncbi:MAG: hypothetical protein K2X35_14285 [Bryobacteraceae bacterium]|nr:hypothetical protein [Bryobacteraceae bacterium]
MKQRILALNFALLVLIGTAGWQLKASWDEAADRQRRVFENAMQARNRVLAPPAVEPVKAASAAGYEQVAQQMLFSRDRNPNVVIEVAPPPPPKPVPDLPVLFGVMKFGDDISLILAERQSGTQKAYRAGQAVGPFQLASVSGDKAVFKWEDKTIEKSLDELKLKPGEKIQVAEGQAPERPGGAPANVNVFGASRAQMEAKQQQEAAQQQSSGMQDKAAPGADMGAGFRTCQVGDTSPTGTVANGFRKVVTRGLFGPQCRWEQVR